MKTPGGYIVAFAACCIGALVIGTSSAGAIMQQGTGNHLKDSGGHFGMEKMLENLTAQGYDVTAIRSAVTAGDYTIAHTLMQEFRTAHPQLVPARGPKAGNGPVTGQAKGERMLPVLDNLTAQGYDVLAIRTAVTSGDFKTAHTLMQEFRTAHQYLFPARGVGTGCARPGGQRGTKIPGNLIKPRIVSTPQ